MDNLNEQLLDDAWIFAQHILIALDCLGETQAMNQIFTSPQHREEYRIARRFYHTAYRAMHYRFNMEVAKLFDVDGQSKTFDAFKNSVYRAGLIGKDTKSEYSELRRNAKDDIEKIRAIRNKVYAHSDKEFFNEPDKFVEEHLFNSDIIKKLLLNMLSICNTVVRKTTDIFPPKIFFLHDSNDFVKLFGYESQADKEFREICEKWGLQP